MNDITFSEHSIIESQEHESSLDHSVKTDSHYVHIQISKQDET